ncbi:MAG: hypothetical protein GQ583_08460 [Methyloprofundus sp.]|nr:hypothetical protein [Methyloprofundus sp.]
MESIILPQKLSLKYPHTFKAVQPCLKKDEQFIDSLLPVLQNRTARYWPDTGVKSDFFYARFPDKSQLIHMAKLATQRRIIYWHPWHMEVTHKAYRLDKKIDWFTPPTGDHEWIDSLVRFTHMIDLTAAYDFTHEGKYLASFENYLNSFSIARKTPGRHWKFLINIAVRLINLIRAYDLIAHEDSLPLSVHLEVLENIALDIEFLLNSLDKVRGNGAFFATTALLIASEFLTDIFDVEKWQVLAEQKLYEILDTEIQSDNIEVEQVPMYHGEVVLTLLDYCIMLKSNNLPISTQLEKTIKGMLHALTELCDPEGKIPAIGDSDRYSITYITNLYHTIFQAETAQVFPATVKTISDYSSLTTYDASGWAIVRWNYNIEKQGYLLFDCSGKPKHQKSGHSHADDLQFLLHTSNGAIFTDPGRFSYCTDFQAYYPFTKKRIYPKDQFRPFYTLLFPKFMDLYGRNWKEYFKRTLSHNTISLNGENQPGYAKRTDPCSKTELLQQQKTGPLVFLQGHLDTSANKENSPPYQHTRTILGVLPHLWIIVDKMNAEEKGNWISSYHLEAGSQASISNQSIYIEASGGAHSMHFLSSTNTSPLLSVDDDWISHIYNKKQPSKTIRTTTEKTSDAMLVTVIQSLENNKMQLNEANTVNLSMDHLTQDIFILTLTQGDSITKLIINPDCKPLKHGELEFDSILSLESRDGENLTEAGFIGGTFLRSSDFSLTCNPQEAGVYQTFV